MFGLGEFTVSIWIGDAHTVSVWITYILFINQRLLDYLLWLDYIAFAGSD